MDVNNYDEFWKRIPPEEKFSALATSHSHGLVISLLAFLLCCALALGFQFQWFLWIGLVLFPLFFQMASNRDWRRRRSHLILIYLAARAASRRYAYRINSVDLEVNLLFRGEFRRFKQIDPDSIESQLAESDPVEQPAIPVWVALFRDAVVIMSENRGGAKPEFIHLVDRKFSCRGFSPEGEGDYSTQRIFEMTSTDTGKYRGTFQLTSRAMPAALVVFERKVTEAVENFDLLAENISIGASQSKEIPLIVE